MQELINVKKETIVGNVIGGIFAAGVILLVECGRRETKKRREIIEEARNNAIQSMKQFDLCKIILSKKTISPADSALLYTRMNRYIFKVYDAKSTKEIKNASNKFVEYATLISKDKDGTASQALASYYRSIIEEEEKDILREEARDERKEKLRYDLEKYKTISDAIVRASKNISEKKEGNKS